MSLFIGPNKDFDERGFEGKTRARYLASWVYNISHFSKLLILVSSIFYCGVYFNNALFHNFMLNPWGVMYYHEWYRIITAQFINRNFSQCIVGLLFFILEIEESEMKYGSIISFFEFLWISIIIELSFIQVELVLFYHIPGMLLIWGNFGLWSMTAAYIVKRKDQTYTNYYLFPRKIRTFMYLGMFLTIHFITCGGFHVAVLVGIIVGFVQGEAVEEFKYPKLQRIVLGVQSSTVIDYAQTHEMNSIRDEEEAEEEEEEEEEEESKA
jgi:membrane associated rhomboid family serine protease